MLVPYNVGGFSCTSRSEGYPQNNSKNSQDEQGYAGVEARIHINISIRHVRYSKTLRWKCDQGSVLSLHEIGIPT